MRKIKTKPKLKSLSYQAFTVLDSARSHLGLTVPEIAEVMGVNRTTYYRLIANNKAGIYSLSYTIDCKIQIVLAVLAEIGSNRLRMLIGERVPLKNRTQHVKALKTKVAKFEARDDTRIDWIDELKDSVATAENYFSAWHRPAKPRKSKK